MHTISYLLGISKQTEVLFLILAGICCTIFDASLFNLHTNLYKVWNSPMEPIKFTNTAQLYVKYILSSIVLVRTFTVHLYLAFYIVMLWPAIFEEKAGLLIPWLIVGAIKCLAMGAMSLSTGLYICLTYRFSKAACWDFLIAQIIDQGPSIYMWFCILSYYYDIKKKVRETVYLPDRQTPSTVFSIAERRRRVRGLFADTKFQNTFDDDRQLISVSRIDNIINQLNTNLRRGTSRSLDSLLARLTAEAEKEEILRDHDDLPEEDKDLSFAQKTLKILNISPSYVSDAKTRKDVLKPMSPTRVLDKNLKVQSSPLLVQKSRPDFRKTKKLQLKLTPIKNDELSLILSETELNLIDVTQEPIDDIDIENAEYLEKETSQSTYLLSKTSNTHVPERPKHDMELREIHINKLADNISDKFKFDTLDVEKLNIVVNNTLENRENHLSLDMYCNDDIATLRSKSKTYFLENDDDDNNCIKKINSKSKVNQKTLSASKAIAQKPEYFPKTLKSKSQRTNNHTTSPTTFKFDGYTMAYIESQRRKAAVDVIKNRSRPRSSGV